MKDSEVRGVVLRALYDIRHEKRNPAIPRDVPALENIDMNVLSNILRHLKEQVLIDFTPLSGGDMLLGRGNISSHGVDVVEGTIAPPISISMVDNSTNVQGSQGVMIGGQGNTQTVALDVEKLFNAIDQAQVSETEKAEAKGLWKSILENPLAKKALEWITKGQVGGI